MSIAENVAQIRERIAKAAEIAGRTPDEIMLVAAAKTNPYEKVREAIAAGVDAVGENRVQEMFEKMEQGAYNNIPLHFIGRLQTNKARRVTGQCRLIESVDTKEKIRIIGKRAEEMGIIQEILIEVNIGSEPEKSGISPEELTSMLEYTCEYPSVQVVGLMAIPPKSSKNVIIRGYFDAMYKLYIDMSGKKYDNTSMRFLSMGMSDSYEEAVKSGANVVRIGSAVFGQRKG